MTRQATTVLDDELYSAVHRLPDNPVLKPEQTLVVVHERPKNLAGVETHLVQSVDEAMEFKRWLGERREVLAIDTETGGFSPYHDPLRLVQFGDAMSGWAIPWDDWAGVAKEALNAYEDPLVMHNASFDTKFLSIQGGWNVPWGRLHDTMIMAHIIDPTQSVALKNLGVRLVDRRANAGEQLLKEAFAKNKWDWATVPVDYDAYWAYGALDCVLTARLFETLRAHERYPQVYDLEMDTRRICTQMEENGSPVDLDYCAKTMAQMDKYVDAIKEWGQETYGINLGSGQKLADILISLGVELSKTTPSGAWSTEKAVLTLIGNDDSNPTAAQLAKTVLSMKKSAKLSSTYFKNLINDSVDGIVHCSINTLGARTARMSIRKPALQTLPKGEAIVRNAFIPSEGNVLVTADMDQVEARLMAHFARDEGLQQAFYEADAGTARGDKDADFFLGIARRLFSDPSLNLKDKRRKLTKNMIYARLYGAGPNKMAETAGVPESHIRQIIDTFDAAYPGLSRYQDEMEALGRQRLRDEGVPYATTWHGRRLPADENRIYTLVNYSIQSTAAEVLKLGIVRADKAGLSPYMILPVHDELVMNVPAAEAEEAKRALREAMTIDDGTFAVPLTASAEGPYMRWGDSIES